MRKIRVSFKEVGLGRRFKLFGSIYTKVTKKSALCIDSNRAVSFNQWQKVFYIPSD